MLRAALFACAMACAAEPAFAFFQGPWNVHEQNANIIRTYLRTGGEASLSPKLRRVIAELRRNTATTPFAMSAAPAAVTSPARTCRPATMAVTPSTHIFRPQRAAR